MKRHSILLGLITVLAAITIIASSASIGSKCYAGVGNSKESSSSFEGVWSGVTAGETGSAITLTLQPATQTLRYGSPRGCVLTLNDPVDVGQGVLRYSITKSTGGYCNKYDQGKLVLKTGGVPDALRYEVTGTDKKNAEQGDLKRSGR